MSARLWLSLALLLAACDDRLGSAPSREAGERAPAVVGGSKSAPGSYVCGVAAGICSCVAVDDVASAAGQGCPLSTCCFVHAGGHCSCRLDSSTQTCDDAMSALGGEKRVASCPP
ncbi:MAG: hypothetical protein QM756_32570 [Polyangiaceae bacterium]